MSGSLTPSSDRPICSWEPDQVIDSKRKVLAPSAWLATINILQPLRRGKNTDSDVKVTFNAVTRAQQPRSRSNKPRAQFMRRYADETRNAWLAMSP